MRYAIVKDNKVENIVEWNEHDTFEPDGELVKIDDQPVDIGWLYDDGDFSAPESN